MESPVGEGWKPLPWRWILPAIAVPIAVVVLVQTAGWQPTPGHYIPPLSERIILYGVDLPAAAMASPLTWGGDRHPVLHGIALPVATGCFWFWFGLRIELLREGRKAPPPGWAATAFVSLMTVLCGFSALFLGMLLLMGYKPRPEDLPLLVWMVAGAVFFFHRARAGWRRLLTCRSTLA
jgi:hypothetical protein